MAGRGREGWQARKPSNRLMSLERAAGAHEWQTIGQQRLLLFGSAVPVRAAPNGTLQMSRSRKKSPFRGFTGARSDQPWKAKAARVFRHAAEQELRTDPDAAALPVKRWARVNPWSAPKDGKQRIAAPGWKDLRK